MHCLAYIAEKTDWKKAPEELVSSLLQQWPDAHFVVDSSQPFSHEWSISISGRSLEGAIHKDGTAIALDGELQDCALFAIWFRTQVPKEIKMLFYDQDYSVVLPLEESTSVSDIVEGFNKA